MTYLVLGFGAFAAAFVGVGFLFDQFSCGIGYAFCSLTAIIIVLILAITRVSPPLQPTPAARPSPLTAPQSAPSTPKASFRGVLSPSTSHTSALLPSALSLTRNATPRWAPRA